MTKIEWMHLWTGGAGDHLEALRQATNVKHLDDTITVEIGDSVAYARYRDSDMHVYEFAVSNGKAEASVDGVAYYERG